MPLLFVFALLFPLPGWQRAACVAPVTVWNCSKFELEGNSGNPSCAESEPQRRTTSCPRSRSQGPILCPWAQWRHFYIESVGRKSMREMLEWIFNTSRNSDILIMKSLCSLISKLLLNVFFLSYCDKPNFPFPHLAVDLYTLSQEKKSVCCEYIFLGNFFWTSHEYLGKEFLVVKLLAGLRNLTWHFQVIYVIVYNLGSLYQFLKFLAKEDRGSSLMYRVLASSSPTQMSSQDILRIAEFPCCFWPGDMMFLRRKPSEFE